MQPSPQLNIEYFTSAAEEIQYLSESHSICPNPTSLFCTFHRNGIMHYIVFCDRLLILGMVCKIHSHCSIYLYFISSHWQIIFYCMDIPHFIYPFINWYTFGLVSTFLPVGVMLLGFPWWSSSKTPNFQSRGPRFNLWSGNYISHVLIKSYHAAT